MGTHAWRKKGINARRMGALERLKASEFTPKIVQGKERNEKNWTKKKRNTKKKKVIVKTKYELKIQINSKNYLRTKI